MYSSLGTDTASALPVAASFLSLHLGQSVAQWAEHIFYKQRGPAQSPVYPVKERKEFCMTAGELLLLLIDNIGLAWPCVQ